VEMGRYNRRSRRVRDVREAGAKILGLAHPSVVPYYFLLSLFAWGGGLCPVCTI
jgi:hypothetical protein